MAVELEDVDEDLISCRICFLRFDEELHKPKYLDCHHSFCIMCIQEMKRDALVISCPFCRQRTVFSATKTIADLSTNNYALRLCTLAVDVANARKVANDLQTQAGYQRPRPNNSRYKPRGQQKRCDGGIDGGSNANVESNSIPPKISIKQRLIYQVFPANANAGSIDLLFPVTYLLFTVVCLLFPSQSWIWNSYLILTTLFFLQKQRSIYIVFTAIYLLFPFQFYIWTSYLILSIFFFWLKQSSIYLAFSAMCLLFPFQLATLSSSKE